MSPMDGQQYGGAIPDYAGEAYAEEAPAHAHERGVIADDERSNGTDSILSAIAGLSSRLASVEQGYRVLPASPAPTTHPVGPRVEPLPFYQPVVPVRGPQGSFGHIQPGASVYGGRPMDMTDLGATLGNRGHGGIYAAQALAPHAPPHHSMGQYRRQLQQQYQVEMQQQQAHVEQQYHDQYQLEMQRAQQHFAEQQRQLQAQFAHEQQQFRQAQELLQRQRQQDRDAYQQELRQQHAANHALHQHIHMHGPSVAQTPHTLPHGTPLTPGAAVMGVPRLPAPAYAKLVMPVFDGTEVYPGLGAAFVPWGRQFERKIALGERACGHPWPEDYKITRLGELMRGKADRFFQSRVEIWCLTELSLTYVLNKMEAAYRITFSKEEVVRLFSTPKAPGRTWNDHLIYLVAVMEATKSDAAMVLENIVKYASSTMKVILSARYDPSRIDHFAQAEELVIFAQGYEDDSRVGGRVEDGVVHVVTETRTCHNCGQVGHLRPACPRPRQPSRTGQPQSGYSSSHSQRGSTSVRGSSSRGGRGSGAAGRGRGRGGRGGSGFAMAVHDFALAVTDYALSGTSPKQEAATEWFLDSAASRHFVGDLTQLHDVEELPVDGGVVQADGSTLRITHKGRLALHCLVDGQPRRAALSNVYYSPSISRNLLSYGTLVELGCVMQIVNGRHALTKDGDVVFYLQHKYRVLVVDQVGSSSGRESVQDVIMSAVTTEAAPVRALHGTLMDFHRRFGHLSFGTIEKMASSAEPLIVLTDSTRSPCATCAEGKQTRASQPLTDTGRHAPIDTIGAVVCSDLKGPITPRDRRGNRYMINFIDHKSNYCEVFLSPTKNGATANFKDFLVRFERRHNYRVHVLRTDGGGEYMSVDLFCKSVGVARQITEANNSAANGKAERMHRTIMNMVRCMLFASGLPLHFWGDAAEYAAYILNRMPTRSNTGRASPVAVLTGQPPSLADIVVFGSKCTVYRDPKKNSLQRRGVHGVIVGKNETTKGFNVFLPQNRVVVTTRHIENVATLSQSANDELTRVLASEADDALAELALARQRTRAEVDHSAARAAHNAAAISEPVVATEGATGKGRERVSGVDAAAHVQPLRRSARSRKPSLRQVEADSGRLAHGSAVRGLVAMVFAAIEKVGGATAAAYAHLPDPKNYREAMQSVDRELWVKAYGEEFKSLWSNQTWEVVKKLPDMKLLYTKWVHKKKKLSDGELERYKARLVACGSGQILGVDYVLTFAAVMDMVSAKMILVIARIWRVPARHFDVPSAYVKAPSEEEYDIFLHIPDGMFFTDEELTQYGVSSSKELALRLKRSLYGLKQAGRLWHKLLHETLTGIGFVQCITDSCLYYKTDSQGTTLVGTYVDDLLATATSHERVDEFFALMGALELKDLGRAENFLGMRVNYDENYGYELDQETTITDMLAKNGLDKANAVRSPISDDGDSAEGEELLPVKGPGTPEAPTVKSFQSLVGSLLWVARCTRPDIAFAVHRATRRAHAPTCNDYRLAKKIARYLAGSASAKMRMYDDAGPGLPLRMTTYTDADYAGDKIDRKSVSGGILMVNGMTVGWHCKKQSAITLSTAEAEFVAASVGAKELLGVRELAGELGLPVATPMTMFMDNQAAIKQVENEASSSQAKHVDVRLKFVRDYSAKKIVKPIYIETKKMLADILTKALPAPRLFELRTEIGVE